MSSPKSVLARVPCVTCTTGREPSRSPHHSGSGISVGRVRDMGPTKCTVSGRSERGYSNDGTVNRTIASARPGELMKSARRVPPAAATSSDAYCCSARKMSLRATTESIALRIRPIGPGMGFTPRPNGAVSRLARPRGTMPRLTTGGRSPGRLSSMRAPVKRLSNSTASGRRSAIAPSRAASCAGPGVRKISRGSKRMPGTPERPTRPGKAASMSVSS